MPEAALVLANPQVVTEEIEAFIHNQIEEAGRKMAVVALSGGVDSALVATLAVRALGPERVVSHALPDGDVLRSEDAADAAELAKALKITHREIPLAEILTASRRTLGAVDLKGDQMAWGNLKPRLHMVVNYFVANAFNGLVLGTGNKTESLLGYFTKYGDGGVDLLPIGHLYKTQVRQLARHVGIPAHILEKIPTAGLWPGQTDEGEIGMSYALMDQILCCLHDRGLSIARTAADLNLDHQLVRRLADMMRRSEHKRRMPLMPS
jgi:NAD+ synthase